MTRIEIKNKAKSIFISNKRFFTKMLSLYFCVLLFPILVTYIVANFKIFLASIPLDWFFGLPTTPSTQGIIKILSTLLSAPVFLLLYKIIYFLLKNKYNTIELHKVVCWIKSRNFIKKSLALGIIMCLLTVTFELLGNLLREFLKSHYSFISWPYSILLPLILFCISILLSVLLDFVYCIAVLYPEKSAVWVTIQSMRVILKNFYDYIVFVLSFLPWFLIEFAGYVLLILFARSFENTYTLNILILLWVSPITMGIGFYFWPYYNAAKAIFCKELIDKDSRK